MMIDAYAYAGGSVLNAIATWKGSAFAVDLKVKAYVKHSDTMMLPNKLAEKVYEVVNEICEVGNVEIRTESEVPPGGGLKSSSAAANAMTVALLKLCGLSPSPYYVLKLSVEASKRAGVTVTGAFDDASASLLGGLVITDNAKMYIIKRSALQNVKAIILPKGGRGMSFEEISRRLRAYQREFERVYEMLLNDYIFEAMTLNGILVASALSYSTEPITEALRSGALSSAVSGNGPSYVALVEEDRVEDVLEAWKKYGDPVVVSVVNEPAYLG